MSTPMWMPNTSWPEEQRDYRRALAWVACQTEFFDPRRPLYVTRAPGRLDVMGGIADYSGALVLEMPIAAATWVAAQASDEPVVVIESGDMRALGGEATVTLPLAEIVPEQPLSYARAQALLAADPRRAWAAYAAGALVVLHAELGRPLRHGLRMQVWSEVPVGKGLSSSAALEVATLEALAPLVGATLNDRDIALYAQKVENFVVGAPCGVMDQMTSALGRRDHLLELLCQPAEVVGQLRVPDDIEFAGVDSGIRHAVSGADYGTVRAAAFMGYRMIAAAAGIPARPLSPGRVAIDDALFRGYLANVPVADWRDRYRAEVPAELLGGEFLARFAGITDLATSIEPARRYPVRAATAHAIEEHQRVTEFRALLAGRRNVDEPTRVRLGQLMYASHASYSACGLGSDGTDHLVALVREAGPRLGLYGAKITGGGSGGTVAVLGGRGLQRTVNQIAELYARESGRTSEAAVYVGSSNGARAFGVRTLTCSGPQSRGEPASSARREPSREGSGNL
jgi:galactokinase